MACFFFCSVLMEIGIDIIPFVVVAAATADIKPFISILAVWLPAWMTAWLVGWLALYFHPICMASALLENGKMNSKHTLK